MSPSSPMSGELLALATRIAVMKAGRKVIDRRNRGLTADDIAHMITSGIDKAA